MTKQKSMIYKPRDEINFLSVKIGICQDSDRWGSGSRP